MAKRLEELLAALGAPGEPDGARERGEELVRTVVTLYGEGLERLLAVAYEQLGDRGDEFFARLCDDKLVEALLCLHGLHPDLARGSNRRGDAVGAALHQVAQREHGAFAHRGRRRLPSLGGQL